MGFWKDAKAHLEADRVLRVKEAVEAPYMDEEHLAAAGKRCELDMEKLRCGLAGQPVSWRGRLTSFLIALDRINPPQHMRDVVKIAWERAVEYGPRSGL
ncbi:MAG: hypothetical protein H6922_04860 [Pseudomonadaceae bacterium]|nr:hypothetical protein [Pseudomonadaceae bacterium]